MKYGSWVPEEVIKFWEDESHYVYGVVGNKVLSKDDLESEGLTDLQIAEFESRHPELVENARNDLSEFEPSLDPTAVRIELTNQRRKLAIMNIPKLLTTFSSGPEAEDLWRYVSQSSDFTSLEFFKSVYAAYLVPPNTAELMAPKAKLEWMEKVAKLSKRLGDLVEYSPFDCLGHESYEEFLEDCLETLEENNVGLTKNVKEELSEKVLFNQMDLSSILRLVTEYAKGDHGLFHDAQLNFGVSLNKPKDKSSHRVYFVKKLSQFLVDRTGKTNRKIVEVVCSCLFGDIDPSKIRKLAPAGNLRKKTK